MAKAWDDGPVITDNRLRFAELVAGLDCDAKVRAELLSLHERMFSYYRQAGTISKRSLALLEEMRHDGREFLPHPGLAASGEH